jgi:uncharacterized protein YkwD
MTRSRVLALAAVSTLLLGAVVTWGKEPLPRSLTPTTLTPVAAPPDSEATPPDSSALVDPQVLEMRAVEDELIDGATASVEVTTTMPPTTTTVPPTTTASSKPATTSSPSPTSPPTTLAPTTTAPSGGFNAAAENDFASRINSYRGSNGLSSLSRSGSLDSYARSWANKMADNGSISHSNIGSLLGDWSSVGENVGMGSSVGAIFDSLVGSAPHKSNMLGDFTHFGIGVYQDAAGTLWTTHVFAR